MEGGVRGRRLGQKWALGTAERWIERIQPTAKPCFITLLVSWLITINGFAQDAFLSFCDSTDHDPAWFSNQIVELEGLNGVDDHPWRILFSSKKGRHAFEPADGVLDLTRKDSAFIKMGSEEVWGHLTLIDDGIGMNNMFKMDRGAGPSGVPKAPSVVFEVRRITHDILVVDVFKNDSQKKAKGKRLILTRGLSNP